MKWGSGEVCAGDCSWVWLRLWLGGLARYYLAPDEPFTRVLAYLYLLGHYQEILSGWFSTADVGYYVLLTALCISLTVQRLEARRILP